MAAPITATSRLRNDYMRLKKDPVPYIVAEPLSSNILEWHYVVIGPKGSPYAGGLYHGKLIFPAEFPFKPPAIYMITPNGRFKPHTRLCLSISDYHPDTWNPAWSVATILTGLLSFMLEKSPTVGSIETSEAVKKSLALASHATNLKDKVFTELFPELADKSRAFLSQKSSKARTVRHASKSEEEQDANPHATLFANEGRMNNNGGFQGAITNFLVIGGFAAFAFVVQYVIQSLALTET